MEDERHQVSVEFGDCDAEARQGVVGTPIVDVRTTFMKLALYGDKLAIETEVADGRNKRFDLQHRIWRGRWGAGWWPRRWRRP